MSHQELLFMPATTAADLIRKRKLSPVDYVDAVLEAIEATQPTVNAFVTVTGDAARKEAAGRYLAEPSLAIGEVAYLVGYSEPAPFHRAFKRWYGVTPDVFRRSGSSTRVSP